MQSQTLQMSINLLPVHQERRTSIMSDLKDPTYSSSSRGIRHSLQTLAMRRAVSCSVRKGPANSSFNGVPSDFSPMTYNHRSIMNITHKTERLTYLNRKGWYMFYIWERYDYNMNIIFVYHAAEKSNTLVHGKIVEHTIEDHLSK